jgi:hypothetical protein
MCVCGEDHGLHAYPTGGGGSDMTRDASLSWAACARA